MVSLVEEVRADGPDPLSSVDNSDLPRHFTRRLGPLPLTAAQALVASDVTACVVAWLTVGRSAPTFLVQAALTLVLFACFRLYRRRLSLSVLDDVPYIVAAVTISALAATAVGLPHLAGRSLAPTTLDAGVLLALLVGLRALSFAAARRLRCKEGTQDVALIVGAGHVGMQLANNFREHAEYGVAPVGFVDRDPRVDMRELPAPLLGDFGDLADLIEDFNVTYVVVAFGSVRESALVDILRTCDRLAVEVFIVPRLFELHNSNRDTDDVWGIPLVRVRRAVFRSPLWTVKRIIDVTASALALLALSPVLIACALAVRWEGGPGVIFRQDRVGLDGRPFCVMKFRSLKPVDTTESQTQWNIKHDGRLGPVGRLLRKTSLDELPQLWNILRGDMSLVGPRPERPHFVEQFSTHIPRYTARHRVPAGLTGWAQAHGLRGDTSIDERARFDNYYIENWSPWLDIKIVCKTVGQVVRGSGG